MASSVKSCKELDAEIGIVIGGGNLFRGEKLNKAGMDRVAGDHMGMFSNCYEWNCFKRFSRKSWN
jgi:Uridylate kinase